MKRAELDSVWGKLLLASKPGGVLYVSFKHGHQERVKQGRHFTDFTLDGLERWLLGHGGVEMEGDFVKVALNVVRPLGGGGNVLPEVLRGWFGPQAGAHGARHQVIFRQGDQGWEMAPAD